MSSAELNGRYTGTNLLWLDADAPPDPSDATAVVADGELTYTWSFRGNEKRGVLSFGEGRAHWVDSFHQTAGTDLVAVPPFGALFAAACAYPAGDGSPDWSWRIVLSQRPTGELVLQMTNLPPWGEQDRAVELVLTREG